MMLAGLGRQCARHRWTVLGVWLRLITAGLVTVWLSSRPRAAPLLRCRPTGHPVGRQLSRFVVDSLYQILRQTATVSVSYRTQGIWPATREVATIRSNPNPAPLGNDTLVTIPSARGEGSFQPLVRNTFTFQGGAGRNHSNVADRGVAQRVIPWMIEAERRAGGLK